MPAEPMNTTPSHLLRSAGERLQTLIVDASPGPWTQGGHHDGAWFDTSDGGRVKFGDGTEITTFHDGRYTDGTLIAAMRGMAPAVALLLVDASYAAYRCEQHAGETATRVEFAVQLGIAAGVLRDDPTYAAWAAGFRGDTGELIAT